VTFVFPSHGFDEAVAAVCHGTISDEQLQVLSELLRHDPAARDEYLVRVELHSRLASEPDLFAPTPGEAPAMPVPDSRIAFPHQFRPAPGAGPMRALLRNGVVAMAAGLALLLAGRWWLGHGRFGDRQGATSRAVAMLNRVVDARWNPPDRPSRLGAPLEPGRLRLDSGLAQIVFYNGARVVIEGPAELQLVSSTEAVFAGGKLTADVPPQARGFRVVCPRLDITDLGTSFGLNVASERTELHVFGGKVKFRSDRGVTNQDLLEGRGAVVEGRSAPRLVAADPTGFASLFDLQAKSVAADALRYDQWRKANERLRRDSSLWVHFDFEHGAASDWRLPNAGALSATVPDGTIVGCQWQEGRWATKPALEFRGVGDRVRLSVPGACDSLTLAAWVRVQGLDRPINSLFMSDGFAPGTMHWVIRNDGVVGLTVIGPKASHQILASPPVLTVDQFGMWTHLAVVLDGRAKSAVHYVNGQPVSQHSVRIVPPFRVGTAELGNWNAVGFPGNDPFLIRNFSGVMDEFCLFSRALSEAEVQALYADGKPQSNLPAQARN
jgi:hypothetical protein